MRASAAILAVVLICFPTLADEPAWHELSAGDKAFESWKQPVGDWVLADSVEMDAAKPKTLTFKPGVGVMVNGPKGRARDLITKESYGDVEAHVEFLIPKGSNSGVKFHAHYEIQIMDSFGKKELTGDDCGGIYPRAELLPKYRHIDKGTAPKVNAAKSAGEWQTLDVLFRAPRFDAEGKKTENARFVKVTLNGMLIHDNVEVLYPTGHAWNTRKEVAAGPLLLQGDHGPVAFRNVRIRPLEALEKKPGGTD
jgi:3-keto-disaccharide hydrolase